MLKHIVLFKLKDNSGKNRSHVTDVLLGMRGKIPELTDFEVGLDVVGADYSFDVAFVARFPSRQELEGYREHPLHKEVSRYVKSLSEDYVKVDYEL
ncbi:Dabb family protein [Dethiobacter alkaliphilus]|uniref:Stress responsive alpha-beta barrel domain protein n=1 Tax=Dethiobacter alkaliphilus AHT 1 TaxID=555088 RepID=C0GK22_DETAL|nr:Dabb family protein [Dethiobacter alkaliphilus]EEG76292.1 Stress responsive alpha-beta barrel domain protein [Dethiobacter alkaliphilus AHT 1]